MSIVDPRGARLRDRFFALRAAASSPGNAGTAAALRAEVDTIDAPPVASVEGLAISFFPTSRFKQLRFIDASEVDASLRPLFARPSAELSHLIAVFVDPEELSYRSFENIIDLDRRFDGIARARLGFGAPARLADGVYQLSLNASARVRALLTGLDALDVYAPPLNPRSRGGRRFIFHSPQLGERLTQKLRQALPE
ncbi:MAG: hypothetical protein KC636_11200, partial [Myxococcales bacterium]|nr:hypothetical protein [Myxococcales bacterium]